MTALRRAFALGALLAFVASTSVHAEVDFPLETIGLPAADGTVERTVEVADTNERRALGYMNRTDIGTEDGMLFVFEPPRPVAMWMKNTPTSLDMIFIEPDGTIESIARNTTPFSTNIVSSEGEVGFVLEVLSGQAEALGLQPGGQLTGARFE